MTWKDVSSVACLFFFVITDVKCSLRQRVHASSLFHYPSIYLEHASLNFLPTSPTHILWVLSALVLSAARLLSLPVRCHNSFHDRSVLSLWRRARAKRGTGACPSPALSSSLTTLHLPSEACRKMACCASVHFFQS